MRTTLQNTRGAAFLLAVYLAALTFVLLGGVSLQRTMTDVRASQISRDIGQAFFLAEAGVDRALTQSSSTVGTQTVTLPTGAVTYTIQNAGFQIPNPFQRNTLQTITATGTATSGRRAAISAMRSLAQTPLPGGVYTNGILEDARGGCGGWLYGNAYSALGPPQSVVLTHESYPSSRIFGTLTINPSDSKNNPYTDLWGTTSGYGANPAVLLYGGNELSGGQPSYTQPNWLTENRIAGGISVASLEAIQPIKTPDAVKAAGSATQLIVRNSGALLDRVVGLNGYGGFTGDPYYWACDTDGHTWSPGDYYAETDNDYEAAILRLQRCVANKTALGIKDREIGIKEIYDGDSLDQSPKGDGLIVLRLKTLQVWPYAQLIFHAPAQIYVEQSQVIDPQLQFSPPVSLPYKDIDTAAYVGTHATLVALDSAGQAIKNGVKILVTQRPTGSTPGAVIVDFPTSFFGSVWAPESDVVVSTLSHADVTPEVKAAVEAGTMSYSSPTPYTWGTNTTYGPSIAEMTNICQYCSGGLDGAELGYVVGKHTYIFGEVRIGTDELSGCMGGICPGPWYAVPPNASDFPIGTANASTTKAQTKSTLTIWRNDTAH